ncbi:MAG: hypothetical protein ACLVG5_07350 [Clostridium sp.]
MAVCGGSAGFSGCWTVFISRQQEPKRMVGGAAPLCRVIMIVMGFAPENEIWD